MRAHALVLVLGLVAGALLAGCAEERTYIVVTVDRRPAVHAAATMTVTLSNASSVVSEDFTVRPEQFPGTFSISAEGRTGELGIAVDVHDADGLLVGRGSTTTTVETLNPSVMVDTADFVVNTEFAGGQQLSNYYPASGFQLAATAEGTWTAVYTTRCSTPCNVFARRFDTTGVPLVSQVAAGPNGFPISATLTNSNFSTPAVAAAGTGTVAVWNATDPNSMPTTYSIRCRALDPAGAASVQVLVAADDYPDLVSIAPLATGDYVVAWDGRTAGQNLTKAAVVKPDCSVASPPVAVSTSPGVAGPDFSHVAANADRILYVWVLDGNVQGRMATNANSFLGSDALLVAKTATEEIEHVRVAPLGGGFGVVVRWQSLTGGGAVPGRIELYRVNNAGAVQGAPTVVTDRAGADLGSRESFGLAPRDGDGSLLVVWHACGPDGDGSGCGVFGRLILAGGQPAAEAFGLATTTSGTQRGPSATALPGGAFATAWTDESGEAPDRAGDAVRARIVYPAGSGAR